MELNKVHCGKMELILPQFFPDNVFDSIATDPPYGISFMNKHWDYQVPTVEQWKEAFRVLKPGGHLLCACGTRTQHRMTVNIEDAGFEIRDVITWHYGSGFPKSLDISKAIDKNVDAKREVIGVRRHPTLKDTTKIEEKANAAHGGNDWRREWNITAPSTDASKQWEGWGTALKPATEFWTLARKPITENTITENILKYGTGGLNIDGSRTEFKDDKDKDSAKWGRGTDILSGNYVGATHGNGKENIEANPKGRYPSNLILDEFSAVELDKQTGTLTSGSGKVIRRADNNVFASGNQTEFETYGDSGGASRFFYCAKADRSEKNKGLKSFDVKPLLWSSGSQNPGSFQSEGTNRSSQNFHPTVKPIELMRYLVKLITPKGGVCLDPFCGSGSTLIGCKLELINFIGIDLKEEYCKIAEARVNAWNPEKYLSQQLFS